MSSAEEVYAFAAWIGLNSFIWGHGLSRAWQAVTDRAELRRDGLACPACGYDLRGSTESPRCPECGTPVPDAVRLRYGTRGDAAP